MHSPLSVRARYLAELDRIGLDEEMCPYGGMVSGNDDAKEEFMRHLRSLAAGATWRDVYPDIPTHWDLGDPDSWTYPYRPIASFDYQTLPTGPVCMAAFPVDAPDAALDDILTDARDAGFRVYGAGFLMVEAFNGGVLSI